MGPTLTQSTDHSTFDVPVTIEKGHSLDSGIFDIGPLNPSGAGFDLVEWVESFPGVAPKNEVSISNGLSNGKHVVNFILELLTKD